VLGYWNTTSSPFRDALNNAAKYVVSTTLSEPLAWPNSTLLTGPVPAAVADLRTKPGKDLHIMGSSALIRTLAAHNLIDEYFLSIHPQVLGSGRRLFADGFDHTRLELTEATPTPSGVIVASYRPRKPSSAD
jgi:dihydrofolate reductase